MSPSAQRDLAKLDVHVRKKINFDILKLEENLRPQGVRKLHSEENLYRLRVGPGKRYRAIYEIQDDVLIVLVVKVGRRKDVYRS